MEVRLEAPQSAHCGLFNSTRLLGKTSRLIGEVTAARADFSQASSRLRAPSRPPPVAPSCPAARAPRRPAYSRHSQPRRQLPRACLSKGIPGLFKSGKLNTELVRTASSQGHPPPPTPPSSPHLQHFVQEFKPVCHAGCSRALGKVPAAQVHWLRWGRGGG